MQADTEPTDMCSKPVAPVQQAATRQPATQQPDLTSAGSSDLSSAGGDPSHSDEEAPDLDETQHHVQEQQSSGGSSDLGSAEDQGQDQSQITHDNQHEDEASDKSDAMSHGSSSGSEAISDRVGEPVDGTAHIDEEAAVQTAAQTLRDPQQEAPLYPGSNCHTIDNACM